MLGERGAVLSYFARSDEYVDSVALCIPHSKRRLTVDRATENIAHLVTRKKSKTWGADGWKSAFRYCFFTMMHG